MHESTMPTLRPTPEERTETPPTYEETRVKKIDHIAKPVLKGARLFECYKKMPDNIYYCANCIGGREEAPHDSHAQQWIEKDVILYKHRLQTT